MNSKWNVTVLLGGPSPEREVSIASGRAVAQALERLGHQVRILDPVPGAWVLDEKDVDVVFLALHGIYGEDGTVQSYLDGLSIRYTGCGAEASRLAFDKVLTKRVLRERGIPTPAFDVLRTADAPLPDNLSWPVIVKPVRQGSSVGLHRIDDLESWSAALKNALQYDHEILAEEFISGRELTVGILGAETLPIVEVRPKTGFYDYRNKYTQGATDYDCPASLRSSVEALVQEYALASFRAVGGRDYGRVDVLLDSEDRPFVLEVNTLPGMTETSLLPKAAQAAGLGFDALCQRMLDLALQHPLRSGFKQAPVLIEGTSRR